MAESFDKSELMDRLDNDVGFLAETVEMLTTDGPPLIEQLRQAVASGDGPALGRAAHALKGMVSNFCAAAAQAGALEVEKIGKSGDLASAPAALDVLETRLQELTNDLVGFIKEKA